MIKKADFDQKGAVRQIPNTGVCLQAKQTVLRGPGGGGGGPWITVFSWNPWTLKGTEKRSYLWLRRSDRTKFSWWTWTWFYSKPMKDMSRLYYEKAETNKTKLLWGKWEVFNKSDIEVDYWMFEDMLQNCFASCHKKFSCRLNQGDRQKRGLKLNTFDLTFLFTTILEKINTLWNNYQLIFWIYHTRSASQLKLFKSNARKKLKMGPTY